MPIIQNTPQPTNEAHVQVEQIQKQLENQDRHMLIDVEKKYKKFKEKREKIEQREK